METGDKLGKKQKEFVRRLRAEGDKQCRRSLGMRKLDGSQERLCCLGLAGLISDVCEWQDIVLGNKKSTLQRLVVKDEFLTNNNKVAKDVVLIGKAYAVLGFNGRTGKLSKSMPAKYLNELKPTLVNLEIESLAQANDRGISWARIADFIEENPELVFNEKV